MGIEDYRRHNRNTAICPGYQSFFEKSDNALDCWSYRIGEEYQVILPNFLIIQPVNLADVVAPLSLGHSMHAFQRRYNCLAITINQFLKASY